MCLMMEKYLWMEEEDGFSNESLNDRRDWDLTDAEQRPISSKKADKNMIETEKWYQNWQHGKVKLM